ncbi:hypothetical protein [Nonomuraea sp. NPDC003709]|uniref:hypothetical protein n=1 Tax=Nonomuraea sp. NPDC003709 TaxID=3154450 RepID=UPI0033A3E923
MRRNSSTPDPAWAKPGHASSRELAVATADIGCKRATGLVAARSAADKGVQLDAIAAHRRDFDRFRRARDAELRAARQVVGNG